ncbi:Coenzyme F420 hydrogenase/dehydrogenase, beta subunit C-terminal domain [Enterococcus faecium]|uniref:Coenzyme F420 hydrogenase/dehydrogenase, beta subunit C-terminal domain n=1 Tax=Enterococcus faecium TaxID=1352 RepID=UPI000AB20CFC|nr:Coenzyme F420 hydrogenase/dehydrogenase, beta subunit C-terminal domain [Enterococcus faecium]
MTGTIDGEEVRIVKEMKELYGGDWGKGLFKIRASDFTDDVMNETADITLGDAWLPEYTMDSEGNNIVIIRNPIIKRIVEKALTEGRIKLDEISVSKIIESQAAHYRHTQEELPYRLRKKEKRNEWIPKKRVDIREPIPFY